MAVLDSIKEDEKYLENVRIKFGKTRVKLDDTLFTDNWFVNNNNNLLKPFLHKNDLEFQLKRYSQTHSKIIRKIIFDHTMWFAIYVMSFKYQQYCCFCNDFQEYISFGLERLWEDIDLFDDAKNASFETFYINDVTFRFGRYIKGMYNKDLVLTDSIRLRIATATLRIVEDNLSFADIQRLDPDLFYLKYNFNKKDYIQAILMSKCRSFEDIFFDETFDNTIDSIADHRSNFEHLVDSSVVSDQICEIVRNRYARTERDFIIWREYMIHGDITYQVLGDTYGLTRERIRQIISRTNKRLRNSQLIRDIHNMYKK